MTSGRHFALIYCHNKNSDLTDLLRPRWHCLRILTYTKTEKCYKLSACLWNGSSCLVKEWTDFDAVFLLKPEVLKMDISSHVLPKIDRHETLYCRSGTGRATGHNLWTTTILVIDIWANAGRPMPLFNIDNIIITAIVPDGLQILHVVVNTRGFGLVQSYNIFFLIKRPF